MYITTKIQLIIQIENYYQKKCVIKDRCRKRLSALLRLLFGEAARPMRDFLLRPICDATAGNDGAALAGGPITFKRVETLGYDRASRRLPLKSLSPDALIGVHRATTRCAGRFDGFSADHGRSECHARQFL